MTKPYRHQPARWLAPLLLAILAIPSQAVHAQENAASLIARIETPPSADAGAGELDALSMPALMARLQVPGVSIAVVKDFNIHWAKAYGVADAQTGRLLDTESRFQAASISKPVTALAAMRLVRQNRLNLDADINTMITSWQVPRSALTRHQAVTPRSLLSHTSGADDGFGFPGYEPGAPLPTLVRILDGQPPSNVGKVVFARAPFEAFKYSGGGLVIMQLALTQLSGRPFAPFMTSSVLAPLRMSNSSFEQPPAPGHSARAALAHDEHGQRMAAPWHVYPEQAAAGLWTTPSDLAKFIIEIQTALRGPNGKILDQRTAKDMLAPAGVGPFAVGLPVDRRGAGWYFSHSGDNWGYRAWMIGHVRKGYGLVIMTNGDNGMALINQIADRVEKAYDWDSLDKPLAR
ncbi:serine hydrolase domain-containing protein [Massilia rubra]|uniref:Beta-lactamase family protein n=1 Tax=Massilia rubra TaxID=2607910 RepID=A0ABX0LTU1_9BURK|nr:serine hydrolase domain-containing protein [Massilia rubra]NHZ36138.1 beta-lactamase family protein [Massilia rubra]